MPGYTFFKTGTRVMAYLSLGLVALFALGIFSSAVGGSPIILKIGSVQISSADLDGSIALGLMGFWLGLLSMGILSRDTFIGKAKPSR